jgi:hypothetical protein
VYCMGRTWDPLVLYQLVKLIFSLFTPRKRMGECRYSYTHSQPRCYLEMSELTPRPGRFAPGRRRRRRLGGSHNRSGLFFFFVDERNLLPLQRFEPLTRSASSIVIIIASGTWIYHWTLNCSSCFIWNCVL